MVAGSCKGKKHGSVHNHSRAALQPANMHWTTLLHGPLAAHHAVGSVLDWLKCQRAEVPAQLL